MTPRDFVYWLKGHFELCDPDRCNKLSEKQVQIIREHIDLVFEKKTPTAIKSEETNFPTLKPQWREPITGVNELYPSWFHICGDTNPGTDHPTTC